MVYLSSIPFKRTSAQRRLRFLVGAVAVVLIIWGVASVPYGILREERARLFGEEATSGLVLVVRSDESGAYPDARLLVQYKYVDPDGYARTGEARFPNSAWRGLRPGTTVRVLLARGRPDLPRIPGEVEPAFQVWLRDLMD